ncbi:MAG: primosomal protein N' [Bacteroidales bacterium]|nr:primosomal protein N' [Bacteroidales bacterium]MBN2761791.1 primosomal protein N' [Bacteroidales bacterium]
MWYADVILPLPLAGFFTYQIPEEYLKVAKPGVRAIVQAGKKKKYTALIYRIHQNKPEGYEVKSILALPDHKAIVNKFQLKLWDWISDYYMCTPGDVYRAAMPAGFKSEKRAFKPKTECYVRLNLHLKDEKKLNELLDNLSRAPRQYKLIMQYLESAGFPEKLYPAWTGLKELLSKTGTSHAVYKSLVKKGILETRQHEVSRLDVYNTEIEKPLSLNEKQIKALNTVKESFEAKDVVLLHGITSSGKTEIYIHLISEELAKGKQVLYLLPEIAITTQIIMRLRRVFGDKVGIYHSKFSGHERVEIWKNLNRQSTGMREPYQIILGVRSSLFLPFDSLGLVIVDEEHENTYKQFDPAPRYHARDTAIMLARLHNAKVLLGSATPSLESYYNCLTGKYGQVELSSRYLDLQPPEIKIVSLHEAYRRKQMKSHFSVQLLEAIEKSLQQHEQVILFQNRRGFSLYLECGACGWVPRCKHCDVSLTYHKKERKMVCHYCGYKAETVTVCGSCGSTHMQMKGFGTEKIEDEIALFFPGVRTARLDIDAIRSRKTLENIIAGFERGEIDMLVGTQMISKGLDFDNVGLVGILNADNMLNYPDFRAYERSFQLMLQVSGRAGRKNKRGAVIIQAYDSDRELYSLVIQNDYRAFARSQLSERKSFSYPPYARLIEITMKSKEREILDQAAEVLATTLKKQTDSRIMGPEYPLISRIRNYHLKRILLKTDKEKSIACVKETIRRSLDELRLKDEYKKVMISVDVDPA